MLNSHPVSLENIKFYTKLDKKKKNLKIVMHAKI